MRLRLMMSSMALVLIGCRDQQPATAPIIPSPPPNVAAPHSAYLSISDLTPEPGSVVVVAAKVRLDDAFAVASFVAQLGYDASALTYLGEEPGSEMMHVVNAQAKQITVAAASAEGSSSGVLFALRFRVEKAGGVGSLALSLSELNDAQYHSQVAALKMSPSLSLDRTLASRVRIR
jgi:hypothetical protein